MLRAAVLRTARGREDGFRLRRVSARHSRLQCTALPPSMRRGSARLGSVRRKEPPFPREPLEDVRPPICEGDAGAGHQILDGVGHEDLAGLGCPRDVDTREYREAAHGPVVILDLTGVYADPHCDPESLHCIADCAPAANGGGRTVKDGEDMVPDDIHLLPAVAG